MFLYNIYYFHGTLLNILLKHLKLQIILPMERAANAIMVILILLQLLAGLLIGFNNRAGSECQNQNAKILKIKAPKIL